MAFRAFHPASWPIAARFSALLVLTALLPLATAVWLAAAESRSALDHSNRENLKLLAGVTAARLDQLIVDSVRTVDMLARSDAVVELCEANELMRQNLRDSVARQFVAVLETNLDVATIITTDRAGIGLVSTNPKLHGMDLTFREYTRRAVAGERYVSGWLVGTTTGEPGLYIAAPVRSRTAGSVVGSIVIKLKGQRLWDMIAQVRSGDGGSAMLVDSSGVIIAHPRHELLYHSLGRLSDQRRGSIDPHATYAIERVDDLGLDSIMPPLTDASAAGSVTYEFADASGTRETWIAGYALMSERPWKVLVAQPGAQFVAAIADLARRQFGVAVAVAAMATLLAVRTARGISRPVAELTAAAERLAAGDLDARAPENAASELGKLSRAFNTMVPQLKDHVNLIQTLEVAKKVQQSLLPEREPDNPMLDIAGRSMYCDATGGDYYDFIDVSRRQGGTLIAIGDVMGHGIGAALLMAAARAALRAVAAEVADLGQVLDRVNRVLSEEARHNSFVTLLLVEIEPAIGLVRWASAGHDPALIRRASGKCEELSGEAGIPLGFDPGYTYSSNCWQELRVGDVMVLGTDGIWEMRSPDGGFFGKERLLGAVERAATLDASGIADAVLGELRGFRANRAQEDDVTMVVVRVRSGA